MINYNKLLNNLEVLKLEKMQSYLPNYLNSIKDQDISVIDVLYNLTEQEIEYTEDGYKTTTRIDDKAYQQSVDTFTYYDNTGVISKLENVTWLSDEGVTVGKRFTGAMFGVYAIGGEAVFSLP